MSSLLEFVEMRIALLDLSITDMYDLYGTKKRFTRHMNFPERTNLELLLRLANRIRVSPTLLIDDYNVGKEMISAESLRLVKRHYRLKTQPIPNANQVTRRDTPADHPDPHPA